MTVTSETMTGEEIVDLCRRHTIFEWSAQAGQATKPAAPYQAYPGYQAPGQAAQSGGSVVEATKPVPPYQVYPGFRTN